MIDYSTSGMLFIRRILQKTGILRPIVSFIRSIRKSKYEEAFDDLVISHINEGDTVWDVGANIGFYTKKFSDKVGKTGTVIAFEPHPKTYETLKTNCGKLENVNCMPLGLSNEIGQCRFKNSNIENDPTNCIVTDIANSVLVHIDMVDNVSINLDHVPTAMKIDVEGFEYDVFQGMQKTLKSKKLKKIFIEMHFLELNMRGLQFAPREMTKMLKDSGFSINWTDPSHIVAIR